MQVSSTKGQKDVHFVLGLKSFIAFIHFVYTHLFMYKHINTTAGMWKSGFAEVSFLLLPHGTGNQTQVIH